MRADYRSTIYALAHGTDKENLSTAPGDTKDDLGLATSVMINLVTSETAKRDLFKS